MAHFARVVDGVVTNVIVADQDFVDNIKENEPALWIRTSYCMYGGVYMDPETNQPVEDQSIIEGDDARERMNFAGIGYTYDQARDVFIPPQRYPSWSLDESCFLWKPPYPLPADDGQTDSDGDLIRYYWDEEVHQQSGSPNGWVRMVGPIGS